MTDPNQTHVGLVTQRFLAIPPEKFTQKLQRTIGGVLLALAGVGLLALVNRGFVGKNEWLERIAVGAIGVGCLSASFEFIKAPLDYALAFAKDIVKLIRGKNGNGNGTTP